MNGVVKYKNKFVQIDDESPITEKLMDGIPIIDKIIYDQPNIPIGYNRGDIITIVSIGGSAVLEEDNIFWVERAITSGGPLNAWEVGICGGRVTNVTVNSSRIMDEKDPINSLRLINMNMRVTYVPPRTVKSTAYGDVLQPILLIDPWFDIRTKDIFTVAKIDGFTTVDQKQTYSTIFVARHPTPVPHLHVEISGALQ